MLPISISFLLFGLWFLRIFVFLYVFWVTPFLCCAWTRTAFCKAALLKSLSPKQIPIPLFLPTWKIAFQSHLQINKSDTQKVTLTMLETITRSAICLHCTNCWRQECISRRYPGLYQIQTDDQAKFRCTYQAMDQRCHDWAIKMWVAAIHFMKAFDSIFGMPSNLLRYRTWTHQLSDFLKRQYKNQETTVMADEEGDMFEIKKKDQTKWSSVELALQPSYPLPCFWCKCFSFLVSRWRSISSSISLLCRMLWCLRLCFHCCLLIYLFLSLLIAVCNSSVVISGIFSSLSYRCLDLLCCSSLNFVVFQLNIVILLVVVELAVELPKDVGNPFPWCGDFALFIFHLRDEYSSSCRFYAGNVPVSIEIFEYYLNLFLPLSFFSCLWCIFLAICSICLTSFLTFRNVSSFYNKPSDLHNFLSEFIINFKCLFCCCCFIFMFLLVFRIPFKNFRVHVALVTDCFVLDLLAVRLIRLRVAFSTDCFVLDHVVDQLSRILVSLGTDCDRVCHLVCWHAMFWEFCTCFSCIRSCCRFYWIALLFSLHVSFLFCFGFCRLSGFFFALFQVSIFGFNFSFFSDDLLVYFRT